MVLDFADNSWMPTNGKRRLRLDTPVDDFLENVKVGAVFLAILVAVFLAAVWLNTNLFSGAKHHHHAYALIRTQTALAEDKNCAPGYEPCLPPMSDYDCAGGSGNGPAYTGPVTVTGLDIYGLDADGGGHGCD